MIRTAERNLYEHFEKAQEIASQNTARVLDAFREYRIREHHFHPSSGYGYSDAGREALENIYARVFGGQDALVRPQLVSGTHAIAACLQALLRPGEELVSLSGHPYDTLANVVNGAGTRGSLTERGIVYREAALGQDGYPDMAAIKRVVGSQTRMAFIQRSRGYQLRPAIPLNTIARMVRQVREVNPDIIVFVDNCYGEFTSQLEPLQVGVDLMAGSLIKNPGGGLAPNGGYVCGQSGLVQQVSWHITAPGLGKELGAIPFDKRYLFMGLFQSPHVVLQALKGAMLLAYVFGENGFQVSPLWNEERSDIVQAIRLQNAERVGRFCQIVQQNSPVDSDVHLEYGDLPGYADRIIMAAGTFIQGSSIELSCDAPLREPYCAFWQGGLSYEHCRYVVEQLAREFISGE
ncbi:MAG TPA: methionine gamma-lyase family protein [Syntrophomonadaceae bacterium]|nr:methionine gamma-lyase family protein [Syntrophomonadaceae bacterium]